MCALCVRCVTYALIWDCPFSCAMFIQIYRKLMCSCAASSAKMDRHRWWLCSLLLSYCPFSYSRIFASHKHELRICPLVGLCCVRCCWLVGVLGRVHRPRASRHNSTTDSFGLCFEAARTATVKLCRSRNNNKLFAILPCLLSKEHGAWWLLLLMHLCLFRLASAGPVWCCVFLCSLLSFDF